MTNAIVAANDWQAMKELATEIVASGMLPKSIDTQQKAIVIMLQARELGIGPMQAFAGINVIQGKATISPQLMLGLIHNSGKLEDIQIDSQLTYCTVTMKRNGQSPHIETFTMDDAKRMKTTEYKNGQKTQIALADKYNWRQMPTVMLKWRAVSACARVVFPDVINGMYTPEELDPDLIVEEDGEIVEQATGHHVYTDAASRALTLGYGEDDSTSQESALVHDQRQTEPMPDYKDASFYDRNPNVCKLTGEEIHRLREDLMNEIKKTEPKMVERHFVNRWKKRLGATFSETEVPVLTAWDIMIVTSEKWTETHG